MGKLILSRHGETSYNQQGLWTGWTDVDLTTRGEEEADTAGRILAPVAINIAFISKLRRTAQSAERILRHQAEHVPIVATEALNERNYGIYTGKSKSAVLEEVGPEEFLSIRRSWDGAIEGGETLKDVHGRVTQLHHDEVMPRVLAGENVLVVSSNNPLRAYVKELEQVPIDQVQSIELGTAEVRIYDFDGAGGIVGREIHKVGDVH